MDDTYYDDLLVAYLNGLTADRGLPRFETAGDCLGFIHDARRQQAVFRPDEPPEIKLVMFKRKRVLPRVLEALGMLKALYPASLLDIGSGRGTALFPIMDAFPDIPVTTIEFATTRWQRLSAVAKGLPPGRYAANHLSIAGLTPHPDGSFDVTTVLEVLEHIPDGDLDAAVAEIRRLTARAVVASVPSVPDDNPDHLRLFTRDSLTALFTRHGFDRVRITEVPEHFVILAQ